MNGELDDDRDLEELTAELLGKMHPIAAGLREALAKFDAGGPWHAPGCSCEVCSATDALRTYVTDLERALSQLEARCTPEAH